MKEETKKLITWAKEHFNCYSIEIHTKPTKYGLGPKGVAREGGLAKDFINFLISLPEIESHLCRGGYIQDCFERPCCNGDRIKDKVGEGTLYWSKNDFRFYIKREDSKPDLIQVPFIKVEL